MADHKFLHRVTTGMAFFLLMLTLSGCIGNTVQSTVDPQSDSARIIQEVYSLVTWIDIGIFVMVFGLLVYALFRFREKKGQGIPKQVHGHVALELAWTIIPAILLVFIAVPTWVGIFRAYDPPTKNALHVKAVGHQWWFEFQYPEQGVVTANELHVPVNRPIVIEISTVDVIHSFWVPRLAGKVDMMPGQKNSLWFTPEKEGEFYGQCAEFCGTSHANMRFRVVVTSQEKFDTWVANLKLPPAPQSDEARKGQELFAQKACVACHTISGVAGAVGVIGPNLTNLAERTTLAAATLKNNPETLALWIRNPKKLKPGALMVLPVPVSEAESAQLAAFLVSRPGQPTSGGSAMAASAAPGGDSAAAKGKQAYMTVCIACHGPDPTKDGAIGPAIAGSTEQLLEARVMNGSVNFANSYPPGYTPKRNTRLMTPFPALKGDISNLAAYLNSVK